MLLADGGQLASMQDQQDYDRIASLIPNDQVANQFGTFAVSKMPIFHADVSFFFFFFRFFFL